MAADSDRFPERLALVAVAFHRDSAGEHLKGLDSAAQRRACEAAGRFSRLSSEDRRALLLGELGLRQDADARLRRLMSAAPAELQAALYRVLPSHARALFPELAATAASNRPPPRPCLRAFAARRVREALR